LGLVIKFLIFFLLLVTTHSALSETIGRVGRDIDVTNEYIANQWDQINRSIDSFFSNQVIKNSQNQSSLFFNSTFTKSERSALQKQYDFQLKIDLPNTTKKLKIVIEKQPDDISNVLSDAAISNKKNINQSIGVSSQKAKYTAGVNYLLTKSKYFVSFIHTGIRVDLPLNPYFKIDLHKTIVFEDVNISFLQKFLLYRQEGFQEISQILFTKKINQNLQADLVNALVWTDETDAFALRNNFALTQDLGDEKNITYSVGANAKLSPTFFYDSYDTSVSYRQLIYKNWLYGTFSVGANFPKSNHFKDEKFVQIRIDLYFKKTASNP
jgi:hypothetical protein